MKTPFVSALSARTVLACWLACVVGMVFAAPVSAATWWKNNTANVLSSTASWWTTETGSTNPASISGTDTLRFGGSGQAASGTWALGVDLAVGAVRLDNNTGSPNYTATISSGNLLTLNGNNDYSSSYVSGIVLNSAAGGALTVQSNVAIGASQRWVTSRNLTVSGSVALAANALTLHIAAGTQTISGNISGSGTVTQDGGAAGGVAVLSGSNSYTGSTFVNIGTMRVTGAGQLGGTASSATDVGNIVFGGGNSNAAIEFETAANLGAATQIRFRNTGGSVGGGGILRYTGSTSQIVGKTLQCDTSIGMRLQSNSASGSVTFNGAFSQTNRPLFLEGTGTGDNTLALVFAGSGALTKRDAGTWVLNQANTYTGVTTLVGGVLKVTTLANGGASSSIGSGSTAAQLVFNGGALSYTGTGHSTDRAFTISAAPTFNANGSGALTWVGAAPAYTTSNTTYTVTLGGTSTAANTWGTPLADNGTGVIGLTKSGAGLWRVSGGNTYTGVTTVSSGTLQYTTDNSLGANLAGSAGAVLAFGANRMTIGVSGSNTTGSFSGQLAGTGTMFLKGGATTIVNSNGTDGATGNHQLLQVATASMPTSAFHLNTGTSATDRKDFGFINDSGDTLTLASLSGYGAFRTDNGGTGTNTRVVSVNQAIDTVFNGALVSHRSSGGFIRALSLTKTGTGSLELAGFIGKETVSGAAGAAPVNVTANGGLLQITNAANTTTTNTDAIWSGTVTVTAGTLGFASQALVNTAGNAGVSAVRMDGGVLRWNAGNTQDLSAGASSRLALVAGKTATFDTNGNDVSLANTLGGGVINAALTKIGAGKLTLAGANSYSGATTVSAGSLVVNGSLANTSGVSIDAAGTLGGSGSITATLSGAGLVSPGNSPGILAASAVDPSGAMSFAFEFTGTGSPSYGSASASVNDVLRLTSGSPFTASLSGANVVDVYLNVAALNAGDTFRGGFYVDAGGDFIASVENATYQYWVTGGGGGTDRTFNGQGYFSLANFDAALTITKSTVADTANFASGSVNGSVTQFVVVPEPATMGLMAFGAAMGCFACWKRRRSA